MNGGIDQRVPYGKSFSPDEHGKFAISSLCMPPMELSTGINHSIRSLGKRVAGVCHEGLGGQNNA